MLGPRRGPRRAGDGFVNCACGQRHWGLLGAAGLLLHHDGHVLLQRRARWAHQGGTWSIPGGALDRDEPPLAGALREAQEELGVEPESVTAQVALRVDHSSWSYTTVLAEAPDRDPLHPTDAESIESRWVPRDEITDLDLHPGFSESWPSLRWLLPRSWHVIVDVANVMGSRPDGWWRDRAGAARSLVDDLSNLATVGVRDEPVPVMPARHGPGTTELLWWPRTTAVLEGAARAGVAHGSYGRVIVEHAPGSGDDHIVSLLAGDQPAPGRHLLLVTSDRGLADRARSHGAEVRGTRWMRDRLDAMATAS